MSTSKIVRAAAVQLSPVLYSCEGTTAKVCEAIAEAARKGAELVVFPETVVPYYPYFSFIKAPALMGADHLRLIEESVTVPGPVTDAIASAAKRAGVVVAIGVNERDHGTLYNTQLLFDADGRLLQARRKITPTYHERMIWGQGDGSGLRAVDTAVGRVGALACFSTDAQLHELLREESFDARRRLAGAHPPRGDVSIEKRDRQDEKKGDERPDDARSRQAYGSHGSSGALRFRR